MGRFMIPKLLTSSAAHALADTHLIRQDLEHVKHCCSLLLDRNLCMLSSVEGIALLDSLAIKYRRCFGSGVRNRLKLDDFEWPDESKQLHDFFYGLADKHIAHSVNNFELNATTLIVAISQDGAVTRMGLGNNGTKTVGLALYDIQRFKIHVEALLQEIQKLDAKLTRHLEIEVSEMTDDEIKSLPSGLAPIKEKLSISTARKWPRQPTRQSKPKTG